MKKSILLIIGLFMFSCGKENIINSYKDFEGNIWESDSIVSFEYEIKDSTSSYLQELNIRHTTDYEFQNLFVFLKEEGRRDTIEIFLSDRSGKWLGRGVGDIREITIKLNSSKTYQKTGEKELIVEQAMRYGEKEKIEVLGNIISLGLKIKKNHD